MATSQDALEETAVELANFISSKEEKVDPPVQLYPEKVEVAEGEQPPSENAEVAAQGELLNGTTEIEAKEQPKEESKRDEFMELARRERRTREISQKNKKLEDELFSLKSQVSNTNKQFSGDNLRQEAQDNPYKFIRKYGLSVEEVANSAINTGPSSAKPEPSHELAELKKEIAAIKAERVTAKEEEAKVSEEVKYNKFIDEITEFVNDNSSDYELVKLQSGETLVGDVIRRHYATSGDVLPYSKACEIVESHLEKRVEEALEATKYKTRLRSSTSEVASTVEQVVQDKPQVGSRPKTLTNRNAASPAPQGSVAEERLSTVDESLDELSRTINFWGE